MCQQNKNYRASTIKINSSEFFPDDIFVFVLLHRREILANSVTSHAGEATDMPAKNTFNSLGEKKLRARTEIIQQDLSRPAPSTAWSHQSFP